MQTAALLVSLLGPGPGRELQRRPRSGSCEDLRDYHLVAARRDKRFGSRDDRRVALASAIYDAAAHTVTSIPLGKLPNQKLQLSITAARTLDSQHRPIDGNRDGQPGGDFRAIFGKGGIRLARVARSRYFESGLSGSVRRAAGRGKSRLNALRDFFLSWRIFLSIARRSKRS